jgi:hypothetical protein
LIGKGIPFHGESVKPVSLRYNEFENIMPCKVSGGMLEGIEKACKRKPLFTAFAWWRPSRCILRAFKGIRTVVALPSTKT